MRVVDLFSGCGGLSKGFENAGSEILAAYDTWELAIECYRQNFTHPVFPLDLSNTEESVPVIAGWHPDIVIGGPPCQDFSHAGLRIEGKRANLTLAYADIVSQVHPHWFLMENVDRIKNSGTYREARNMLKSAGYGLTERVFDASRCGVPQRRKRFICIGKLGSEDGFLDDIIDLHLSNRCFTVRDYLGDTLGVDHYYRHPRNYARRGVFSIDEPAPTIRGVNRPVPKGYPGHPGDKAPVTPNLRSLTTAERAQIQTFPSDFVWVGSKTDREQMIGNAVPIKLAEFLARRINEFVTEDEDNGQHSIQGMVEDRYRVTTEIDA